MTARTDAQLIEAILAGSGSAGSLSDLAAQLAVVPFWERRAMTAEEIRCRFEVGLSVAEKLAALWELADRQSPDDRPAVNSVADALHLLHQLRLARREEVHAIFLDSRHRLLAVEVVAMGASNSARLSAREVFVPALRHDAVAVILGHNHPSGDATPSTADQYVTDSLRTAANLIGIKLCDHVIITAHSHFSFREAGEWDDSLAA